MTEDFKGLMEELEKAEPNSCQDFKSIIERHIENTNNLNMLLDAIPKYIAQLTGEKEYDVREIVPDIMDCNTSEGVVDVINKWVEDAYRRGFKGQKNR